ncbi:MAG: hypothetical protein HQM04_00130 [Magnetococcales bacterium]|nr:hypothetical protein [Magnetococcales bacterium]MBF0113428.1 hypothetical protein [Magnetococcales bacterium]
MGLRNGIDHEQLSVLAAEQRVRLIGAKVDVSHNARAFYANQAFLQTYESGCGVSFPWAELTPIPLLTGDGNKVVIADEARLLQLRRDAAERLLQALRERIPREYPSGWQSLQNDFLPKMEKWSRCGALCVGSAGGSRLYRAFHRQLAATLFLRGDDERLNWVFKRMVQPHCRDISSEEYATSARQVAKNWQARNEEWRRLHQQFWQQFEQKPDYKRKNLGVRSKQACSGQLKSENMPQVEIILANTFLSKEESPSLSELQ